MRKLTLVLISMLPLFSGCPDQSQTSSHAKPPSLPESSVNGTRGGRDAPGVETYELAWISWGRWFILSSSSEGCSGNVHVYASMIIKQGGQPFGIMVRDCRGRIIARFEAVDEKPTATKHVKSDGSEEWVLRGPLGRKG